MSKVTIREAKATDRWDWDRYVLSRDHTTFVDRWAWRELVERVYYLPHYWFFAERGGAIEGILALTLTTHPLLGRYLATAPFATQGGFYADSKEAHQVLLEQAAKLQNELNARYVVLRHLHSEVAPPEGWIQDPVYATYHLPLNPDPERFWREHLRYGTRRKIRISMRHGFRVAFGRKELLEDFWEVISRCMKELGSPYHPRGYLEALLELQRQDAEFAIMYEQNGGAIGGSLLIHDRNQISHLYSNGLYAYRSMCANYFLYWSVIAESCRRGIRQFDMCRSLVNSGNEMFKIHWRPHRRLLAYWYRLRPGVKLPRLNQANPRYKSAIRLWQEMPLWLAKALGPYLIRGIL